MKPFRNHMGKVAVLDRINVDTDQIIPKQFLKRIERTGFGQFLFYDWRFLENGEINPEFELNQPRFQNATILLTGHNFGCGSSREHAPWALQDYGFRVLIGSEFADIFFNNCFKNGLLAVVLPEQELAALKIKALDIPGYTLSVDLESRTISDPEGLSLTFEVDPFRRDCLLNGIDDIGLTLQSEESITRYEASRPTFLSLRSSKPDGGTI